MLIAYNLPVCIGTQPNLHSFTATEATAHTDVVLANDIQELQQHKLMLLRIRAYVCRMWVLPAHGMYARNAAMASKAVSTATASQRMIYTLHCMAFPWKHGHACKQSNNIITL